MRLDSARAFKAQIQDSITKAYDDDPTMASFFASTERPLPVDLALGVAAGRRAGDFHVAIRSSDGAMASRYAEMVNGEADVRILTIEPRTTPAWLQGKVRPLEPGVQVGIQGKDFVGTLGAFVMDARGVLYALTNAHVASDMGKVPMGTPIGQPYGSPATMIGVRDRDLPVSSMVPNLADACLVRLNRVTVLPGYNAAVGGNLLGAAEVTPDDLGLEVLKIGRTTGVRKGRITAIDLDGVPVNYGPGVGVLRWNDQFEVSGGPGTDFSQPGDSGSLIVDSAGFGRGLLYAGGADQSGEDFTYANRLTYVLSALGVTLLAQ